MIVVTVDLFNHLVPTRNRQAVGKLVVRPKFDRLSASSAQPTTLVKDPMLSDQLIYATAMRKVAGVTSGLRIEDLDEDARSGRCIRFPHDVLNVLFYRLLSNL